MKHCHLPYIQGQTQYLPLSCFAFNQNQTILIERKQDGISCYTA